MRFSNNNKHSLQLMVLAVLSTMATCGCYAPLTSPGVAARDLPDEFRFPVRSNRNRLNLAELTIPQRAGEVGPGDLLSVHVHGLSDEPTNLPLQVRVLEDGTIDLPLIGSIPVAGRTLPRVRDELVQAYERGKFLESAQVSVQMIEVATVQVVVIGEVQTPGVYTVPRNQADVGRALALAGGMTEFAGDAVEVHSNSDSLFSSHAANLNTPAYQSPALAPQSIDDEDADLPPAPVPPPADTDSETDPDGEGEELFDDEPASGPLSIPQVRRTFDSGIRQVSYASPTEESDFEQMFGGHTVTPTKPKRKKRSIVHQAHVTASDSAPRVRPIAGDIETRSVTTTTPARFIPQTRSNLVAVPLLSTEQKSFDQSDEGHLPPRPIPQHPPLAPQPEAFSTGEPVHTCIALAGSDVRPLSAEEVRLHDGDVVTVPRMKDDVFYIVGPLNNSNRTSFNVGNRDLREIGTGFIIPRNRDIDVITGVAMAGYIDPINSPTTVSVHRRLEDGRSLLIKVNLIEARYDRRETVMLRPGDIVYLNPDAAWWSRRYFDQVAPDLFRLPWRFWTQDWILGSANSSAL